MNAIVLRLSGAKADEVVAALWSFLYFFALLAGYYVLRPIRDEMAMQVGAQALQELFLAVFLSMLVMVPLFGWLTRHFPRHRLLPWLYAFCVSNLVGFYFVLEAGGHHSPLVARVFYVWVSVFNLFVVSVFWSFMADIFNTEQARRLYGFIAAGGTLGALLGPLLTAGLVRLLGAKLLVLVSGCFLVLAIVAILRLRAWARHTGATGQAAGEAEQQALAGSVWSGLVDVLRSGYLLAICAFLFSYALLSTFLYFQTAELLPQAVANSVDRTRLLAQVDLAVNVLTLLVQTAAFGRLISRLGSRALLAVMPLLSIFGFAVFALWPLLAVLVGFGVLRRAGEYSISKPARETLFNALPAAQKYRAKNVIDTLVHRSGDTASAWIFNGLRLLGFSSIQISWLSVPIAAAWFAVAVWLGGQADKRYATQTVEDAGAA